MTILIDAEPGSSALLMGNEAIVRGALEAGVNVAASYPGTPSSEIIGNLAGVSNERNLYVEWSVNEKVATEVAAAASYAGLRALVAMKQVGMNVAADFLLHLSQSGTRGGMVLVSCEDPGAFSSTNEGESRPYAKMMEFPLLEIGDFQEAKDITKWAFELSEEIRNLVMVRSVTRLSHSSGNVVMGELPEINAKARFKYHSTILDQMEGPIVNLPVVVDPFHRRQQEKLKRAAELFEDSPFNSYDGPDQPELLIITSSVSYLYSREAIQSLGVENRVGLLKLGTTYPLPPKLIKKYLKRANRILIVEEIQPFLEDNIEAFAAREASDIGTKTFHGKNDGTFPVANELNPDMVIEAISKILTVRRAERSDAYVKRAQEIAVSGAPSRELTFCPGCPHRASFWSIHNILKLDNRDGFVCGDIGCYGMAAGPTGFQTLKTLHAMGSATGLASGFGKLGRFGMDQPVFAICGDSTFFHAVMPALVNAIHSKADITLVILDNSGTAMTGFQAHPGLNVNAAGGEAPAIDIPGVCKAMGATVEVCDPFDIEATQQTLLDMIDRKGVKVIVLKQICALSPEKKGKKQYEMIVGESLCSGETCGCNRLCTRIFKCPGLIWDKGAKTARIDRVICAGCGVCTSICPAGAILREEVA
jgi:indolepyruvate ferredoxin oxidoreductase alpha subunit